MELYLGDLLRCSVSVAWRCQRRNRRCSASPEDLPPPDTASLPDTHKATKENSFQGVQKRKNNRKPVFKKPVSLTPLSVERKMKTVISSKSGNKAHININQRKSRTDANKSKSLSIKSKISSEDSLAAMKKASRKLEIKYQRPFRECVMLRRGPNAKKEAHCDHEPSTRHCTGTVHYCESNKLSLN